MDLPDAENRMKILKIILTQENLKPDFQFEKLANATEGYSGSDLKVMHRALIIGVNLKCWVLNVSYFFHTFVLQNLCIAAAYRPVQELLEGEKKVRLGFNKFLNI